MRRFETLRLAKTAALAVTLWAASAAGAAAAAMKVATVDMALVYKNYPEVIKTTYYLKQKKDEFQAEVDKDRRKIEDLTEELKTNRAKLSETDVRNKENDKRRMLFDLQTKFQKYKEKLQDLEQEEFERIRGAVKAALDKLAKSRRVELVVEKQWCYFGEAEDLTESLISSLGGELDKGGAKPAPGSGGK
jgi:Skp family chaperone for outer membrane proteins